MRRERDVDMILLNLRVKPDAAAKRAARERMLACRAGLPSAADGKGVYELTDDELGLVSAAGPGDRLDPQNKGSKHDLYDTQDLPDH